MSETENQTPDNTDEGVEIAADQADKEAAETTDAETADEADADDEDPGDELPDWAREKLTKANSEAARYRTQLREAQDKLKDAKTPEDVEMITKDLAASVSKLERELVVATFQLPEDLASLVTGTTREEMEASAKILKKYAPEDNPEPRDVSGGLTPGQEPGARQDPGELARQHRRRY
jgi:hypothetical protein